MIELTERDYRARVAGGAWPARMRHGRDGPWYDYTRVVVVWPGEATPVAYAFAPRGPQDNLDGCPDRSALDRAQAILSAHAQGYDVLVASP